MYFNTFHFIKCSFVEIDKESTATKHYVVMPGALNVEPQDPRSKPCSSTLWTGEPPTCCLVWFFFLLLITSITFSDQTPIKHLAYNTSVYSLGNFSLCRSYYPLLYWVLLTLLIYKELECNKMGRLQEKKIARLVNKLHNSSIKYQ